MGLEYYRDQWICHCPFEICMNQLQLNQENCPSEKRFDSNSYGNVFVSVFTHIDKKIN